MSTTNPIEEGKKWAVAVDAARPSAKQSDRNVTMFTDITVPSNYVLTLDQLAEILRNVRAQVAVDYHRQFKSGALATLSIVGARASLQAQQNEQAMPATAKEVIAKATFDKLNSTVSHNISPIDFDSPKASSSSNPVRACECMESGHCSVCMAKSVHNPTLQETEEYFDTVYGMHKPSGTSSSKLISLESCMGADGAVDWKHAAAQLQKQVLDLQGELHNREQKVAELIQRNKELAALAKNEY
jgi:hypothetical protein